MFWLNVLVWVWRVFVFSDYQKKNSKIHISDKQNNSKIIDQKQNSKIQSSDKQIFY
jgi:hypothetical protein